MPRDDSDASSSRKPRRTSGERTGRPARPFVKGSRPPRPAGEGRSDRPDRPPRRSSSDSSDRPARSFDRDRPPRRDSGDRTDRPARSFDRDRAPRRSSSDRSDRPARSFDRDRPPRRDSSDRPDRPRRSSSDRSDRPARSFDRDRAPRRDSGDRPDRPRRDNSDRPARSFDRDRAPRRDSSDRPARSFDRDRAPRRDSSDRRPRRDSSDRPVRARRDDAPDTRTTAQQKSDDVARRTGGRRYGTDPYPPAKHTRESWQDEGSTRRSSSGPRTSSKRSSRFEDDDDRAMTISIKNVEAGDANKIKEQLGATADRAIERLARSLHAFEAHRYSEARKLIMPLLSQVIGIAVVHEVAGLSMYRLGRWQDAADQLEIARGLKPAEVVNHPVLADCYRALRRYEKVTELWESMKLMSPQAGLLAEGRIVAAGALADQGELQSAVRMMTHGTSDPHKVQEHHLREWYVLADLYDRAGDVASARRLFVKIQSSEPKFADVADRLNTLGE
jgi:tetratricopeptide (TPR) repeat protein